MVCSVGMTGVVKSSVKVNEASLVGKLRQTGVPKIKEPIPHLRFGNDIKVEARVYKVHGSPNFFPISEMWTRLSSPTLKLNLASRALSKGKS